MHAILYSNIYLQSTVFAHPKKLSHLRFVSNRSACVCVFICRFSENNFDFHVIKTCLFESIAATTTTPIDTSTNTFWKLFVDLIVCSLRCTIEKENCEADKEFDWGGAIQSKKEQTRKNWAAIPKRNLFHLSALLRKEEKLLFIFARINNEIAI